MDTKRVVKFYRSRLPEKLLASQVDDTIITKALISYYRDSKRQRANQPL